MAQEETGAAKDTGTTNWVTEITQRAQVPWVIALLREKGSVDHSIKAISFSHIIYEVKIY